MKNMQWKFKFEITILILWIIAGATTVIMLDSSPVFTYLGPVYLICMIGSVITVHKARSEKNVSH